jgi:hypothetical protein
VKKGPGNEQRIQGVTMRQFFRKFNVGDGDQFEVVVDE